MKHGLKQLLMFILAALIVFAAVACADPENPPSGSETTESASDSESRGTEEDGRLYDDLPDADYKGADFLIWTYDNSNMMCPTLNEEAGESDAVSVGMYNAALAVEERFKINLEEVLINDRDIAIYSNPARAGTYEYDVANARCIYTVSLWSENLLYTFDNIPHVDLSKGYWNQSANESLSINNVQYAAIGGYSVATYSLVHVLLFNKGLIEELSLENPYELVKEDKWTFDAMNAMMTKAIKDLDGSTTMDGEDRYGYLAHYKEVLPSFWIAADTFSINKDEDDIPYSNISSEKFNDVFTKVYEMLYDTGAWYKGSEWNLDVPDFCIRMFGAGQSLFMDTTFHAMSRMRDISNIEFGILPYPKWNETQEKYRSRVEYYNSQVVPNGVENLDRTGMILEALNCAYYNEFLPAYYETTLQRKYAAFDEESSEMLDIVFDNLVVDIGDTTLCDKVRDGIFMQMFLTNNRNLSSVASRCDTLVNKALEDFYE